MDISRAVLNSPTLRAFIVEMRPYFGLSLLKMNAHRPADFCELYLGALIERRGSALYQELAQNQNMSCGHRYVLPERNRLLHFLFADAETANRLYAWLPIGEHALKILRPAPDNPYLDRLNRSPDDFENGRWQDPLWIALFFFDLMVSEAAHQDIAWHMWLFYVPKIIRGLVEGYRDTVEGVDPRAEFPTYGARLIYEAVNMMGAWVKLADDLPAGSTQREVQPDLRPDPANIPKSAALALGQSLETIITADHLGGDFKEYMVRVVAGDLRSLRRPGAIRAMLVASLAHAGAEFERPGYRDRLRDLYGRIDHVVRDDTLDLAAALGVG